MTGCEKPVAQAWEARPSMQKLYQWEGHVVRSAGRPPWFLGTTTGTGCLVAGWQLQHPSPATQVLWCAYALITVVAGGWRLYLQVQVDREWLRRLRGEGAREEV